MKKALALVTLAVVALVGWWNWHFREIVVAYRLTAEVQVDGELHVGSGVVEIRYRRDPFAAIDQNGPWINRVVGEAVPVSLGQRGTLFFTLGPNNNNKGFPQWLPATVIGDPAIGEWGPKYFERLATAQGVRDIPLKLLPRLVLFSDPTRPETAECVDPEHLEDSPRLKGAQLLHGTLEMVQEPATKSIERLMPWLGLPRSEMVELVVGRVFWDQGLQNASITCKLYPRFFETGR